VSIDAAEVVVLGRMSRYPVAGITWLTMQYVLGFERLGHRAWYVELDDGEPAFVAAVMARFGLPDRWGVDLRRWGGNSHGLSGAVLDRLYASADRIVNLHGGTKPLDDQAEGGRLVYLETDPGELAVGINEGAPRSLEFLARHARFFTWAENYGAPDCGLPTIDGFAFEPTRQPVLVDAWQAAATGAGDRFTTIGNWRQPYKEVELDGETYYWSKHLEFLKFVDLPTRSGNAFELALSSFDDEDRALLERNGWVVSEAAAVSGDADAYRRFIAGSRGEFTVAKDQNVRLRTGWMGDRSPTYLAAGRPVILQDTGFGNALPTGEGLFAFSTIEDVLAAVDSVNADYERHSRAAAEIAREYFSFDVVLPRLLT
jgi:hypothetical protein